MKTRRTVVTILAALWLTAAAAAQPEFNAEARNLQVQEYHIDANSMPGVMQIVGTARNAGRVPLSNVFIEINLYDERGTLVGNTIAHGSNLSAGGWWKFSAPAPVAFHSAEIVKITAYR